MKRRFNLCTAGLVVLCMLLGPAAIAQTTLAPDQYEPNNTQSAARQLGNQSQNVPNIIHANLHGPDDQSDWYSTTVLAGSNVPGNRRMSVRLTSIPSDFSYEVTLLSENSNGPFDPSGEVARSSGTGTVEVAYTWNTGCGFLGLSVCNKTIHIHVRRADENAGAASYDLTLTAENASASPIPSVLPQVLNFTPTSGPVGTTVMIVGENFTGTTSVKFKGVSSTFTITADNSISATVPPGAITGFITVVSPAGGNSSSSNFTVTSETAPTRRADGPLSTPSSKKDSSKKDSPLQVPSRSSGGESGPAVKTKPAAENIPGVQMPTMHGGTPCCSITGIATGGLVTAQDTATGKTFQFHANDQALLKSLRIGQKVYADFGTQQVSVDGAAPCCGIVSAASGPMGTAKLPSAPMPTIHGVEPCCNVLANAALKGRLGRVVVVFPDGAVPKSTRVEVRKEGKVLQSGYGNKSWELPSGTYEVSISGKQVPNVTVKAGHDTMVKVGVLRVSAGKGSSVDVLDGGNKLTSGYGDQIIGLPPGAFDLKVAGQTQPVTISEGQVTDF